MVNRDHRSKWLLLKKLPRQDINDHRLTDQQGHHNITPQGRSHRDVWVCCKDDHRATLYYSTMLQLQRQFTYTPNRQAEWPPNCNRTLKLQYRLQIFSHKLVHIPVINHRTGHAVSGFIKTLVSTKTDPGRVLNLSHSHIIFGIWHHLWLLMTFVNQHFKWLKFSYATGRQPSFILISFTTVSAMVASKISLTP